MADFYKKCKECGKSVEVKNQFVHCVLCNECKNAKYPNEQSKQHKQNKVKKSLDDYVECPICGYKAKVIINHIIGTHGLDYKEFKNMYPNASTMCKSTREKISKNHKGKIISVAHRERISKKLKGVSKLECYGTSIAKIKSLQQSSRQKGALTLDGYTRRYGAIDGVQKYNERSKKISAKLKGTTRGTYESMFGYAKAQILRNAHRTRISQRLLLNNGIFPNYNKTAIQYFKTFNLSNCYFTENPHEFYISELGYWPDFIDFDLKLIIEIDERHHFDKQSGLLMAKDKQRQNAIQEFYPDFLMLRFDTKNMHRIAEMRVVTTPNFLCTTTKL
jgi:hypothetical protein